MIQALDGVQYPVWVFFAGYAAGLHPLNWRSRDDPGS